MMPNSCILNIFSGVFLQKNVKIGLKNEKSFVEMKPVSVVEHVDIWQFIFVKVV